MKENFRSPEQGLHSSKSKSSFITILDNKLDDLDLLPEANIFGSVYEDPLQGL